MKELRFDSYTSARLPSGTYLFFPSLEERAAAKGQRESVTIVAYDHPPYSLGALATATNLHLAMEEAEFEQLERAIERRDLSLEPVVIKYEPGSSGEVLRRVVDAEGAMPNDSYIRGLQPPLHQAGVGT